LEEHFLRYCAALHACACGKLSDLGNHQRINEAAKDVVQEVFLRAIEKSDDLDVGENFFGWLLKTTDLCAKEAMRREKVDQGRRMLSELVEHEYSLPEISEGFGLEQAIDRLDDPLKTVLLLKYYGPTAGNGALSCKDIAQILDLPIGTVTCRLTRAYSQMHGILTGRKRSIQRPRTHEPAKGKRKRKGQNPEHECGNN
jgi:RNA polymerase sigma factor (sigma-70 family)